MPATSPARPPLADAQRARRLLLGLYVLLGTTVATWLSRLPSVRDALDLTSGQLGMVLLVGAVGSLVTVVAAGAVVTRFGSRATLLTAAGMFSGATVLLGVGPTIGSVAVLTAGVFVMTASFALGNVPMNVETVVIERAIGRTIVPQFHAAFSVGTVVGSLLGAAAAWADVPLLVHFGAVSVLSLVWRVAAVPGAILQPDRPSAGTPDEPAGRRGGGARSALAAWRERRTLLLGVLVMTAALSEGSANNWLAIAVVDGFEQTEAVAAVVFGVFVASMTVARLAGGRLIDRYGPNRVIATSGAVSAVGLLLFGTAPGLPAAGVGVVLWGLGAGLVIPIGLAAVSHDPLRAAGRVAVVSAFATVANLAAPPLLGMAAETLGARHALLLVGVGLVVSVGLARHVHPPRQPAAVVPTQRPVAAATPAPGRAPVPTRGTLADVRRGDPAADVAVPETVTADLAGPTAPRAHPEPVR